MVLRVQWCVFVPRIILTYRGAICFVLFVMVTGPLGGRHSHLSSSASRQDEFVTEPENQAQGAGRHRKGGGWGSAIGWTRTRRTRFVMLQQCTSLTVGFRTEGIFF